MASESKLFSKQILVCSYNKINSLVIGETLMAKMAVFILQTDNPSRRIIRLLFYVSSINTGRITASTKSASRRRIR